MKEEKINLDADKFFDNLIISHIVKLTISELSLYDNIDSIINFFIRPREEIMHLQIISSRAYKYKTIYTFRKFSSHLNYCVNHLMLTNVLKSRHI